MEKTNAFVEVNDFPPQKILTWMKPHISDRKDLSGVFLSVLFLMV